MKVRSSISWLKITGSLITANIVDITKHPVKVSLFTSPTVWRVHHQLGLNVAMIHIFFKACFVLPLHSTVFHPLNNLSVYFTQFNTSK